MGFIPKRNHEPGIDSDKPAAGGSARSGLCITHGFGNLSARLRPFGRARPAEAVQMDLPGGAIRTSRPQAGPRDRDEKHTDSETCQPQAGPCDRLTTVFGSITASRNLHMFIIYTLGNPSNTNQ